VASTIVAMLDDGWEVVRDDGSVGAARLDDIAILIPSRLCLGALESELRRAEIPYRLETRSLVWNTQEVRELLATLAAIDDPGDAIATVAALRSPAFGCGDDDLFTWYRAVGNWDYRRGPPDDVDANHPVARSMLVLRELHEERWWLPVSTLVERVARERRLFEFAFAQRRPRDVWRRLRWVIDQARAFTESGGGTLHDFLRWTEFQASDTSVAESVLPEADDEAVRVLTIHGSKGREFPITVLAGMSTENRGGPRGPQVRWLPEGGPPEISLSLSKQTDRFDVLRTAEEQMGRYERVRLLYVAATRARDHLVVSAHHKDGKDSFGKWIWDHCERSGPVTWQAGPDRSEHALKPDGGRDAQAVPSVADRTAFAARRSAALEPQKRPAAMSATAIAHAAGADEVDPRLGADGPSESELGQPSLVPTRRGRAGTAIGRATHAVLQHADFDGGDEIDQLACAEAAAESVPDLADEIAAKARAALASEIVQMASRSRHWRELYVAAPLDGVVVEGYIDLLVRTPDGLVVVDYKTDSVRSDADVDAALERYRLQGATYARLVETVVGEPVVDCVFLFLSPTGAKERRVTDLEQAKAEVSGVLT
jgi:ATP-dependent exoDNAse (exonuclease V) beta subunit